MSDSNFRFPVLVGAGLRFEGDGITEAGPRVELSLPKLPQLAAQFHGGYDAVASEENGTSSWRVGADVSVRPFAGRLKLDPVEWTPALTAGLAKASNDKTIWTVTGGIVSRTDFSHGSIDAVPHFDLSVGMTGDGDTTGLVLMLTGGIAFGGPKNAGRFTIP